MAQDPIEIIEQIISSAIYTADKYTRESKEVAEEIIDENIGIYLEPPSSSLGFGIAAVEPDVPEVSDTIVGYEAQLNKIVALLSGQLAGFFNTYYPLSADAYDEANAWILNQITNGGTGVNKQVAAELWQRAREKIIRDARSIENQLTVGYAAKGYSIPPGAMLAKIENARFAGLTASGEAATTIAAKMFDAEVDMIKFAVGQALDARKMAMSAAADYIRAVASAPDSAVRTYNMKDENRARMINAAADWYRSRLSRDEIVLKSKLAEMEMGYKIYEERRNMHLDADRVKIDALGKAADVYGKTASAALSSLNSIVSTAANI